MLNRKLNNWVLFFLSSIVSTLIAFRFLDVGKDTIEYTRAFYKYSSLEHALNGFEIGFSLLIYLISKYTESVELFFFVIAFIITTSYLYLSKKFYQKIFNKTSVPLEITLLIFSLLLLSSWYITMTTNGIRQGVSLVFIYLALFEFFFNNKKLKFLILYLLAISFHYSSLLIIPFLLFKYLKFKYVFVIWFLTALGYVYGVNELIVMKISSKFNLPIYDFIKYYSLERGQVDGGHYNGFDWKFFIYTIFWPLLLMVIFNLKFRIQSIPLLKNRIYILLKIYFLLSVPYFVFGFGPFSNRYAMLAWFMVPLLQLNILNSFKFKGLPKVSSLLFLLLVFIYFLFITLDWKRNFI
ncbi:EpsG family protein [Polaribacter sp.]|nr:EpsG family protein [Polaribacter sp.]